MNLDLNKQTTDIDSLQLKCQELEDEEFEVRREGMQQFKTSIKNLAASLPAFRANVKALTAPLEELNKDIVNAETIVF